jgi:crossover junction endodeoxyribonuclease RusA
MRSMSESVIVRLPFPPSANILLQRTRTGMAKSARYKAWKNTASWMVKEAILKTFDRKGVKGPYALYVLAGPPDKRKRDLDNLLKATSDALKAGGAVEDDSLCQRIEATWSPDVEGILVTVMSTKLRVPLNPKKAKRTPNVSYAADHAADCEWHHDQYGHECTCGVIERTKP